jgi:hypothetical protein
MQSALLRGVAQPTADPDVAHAVKVFRVAEHFIHWTDRQGLPARKLKRTIPGEIRASPDVDTTAHLTATGIS